MRSILYFVSFLLLGCESGANQQETPKVGPPNGENQSPFAEPETSVINGETQVISETDRFWVFPENAASHKAPLSLGKHIFSHADGLIISGRGISWTENATDFRTYTSSNGLGSSMTQTSSGSKNALCSVNELGEVYVLRKSDKFWQKVAPETAQTVRFHSVFCDDSTLYAGTDVGFSQSHDWGLTWKKFQLNVGAVSLPAVRIIASSNRIYAQTKQGISISSDSGLSWRLSEAKLGDLSVVGSTLLAATPEGKLAFSVDDGRSWEYRSVSTGTRVNSVYASSGQVLVGTSEGLMLASSGLRSFEMALPGEILSLSYSPFGNSNKSILALLRDGYRLSTDRGVTWKPISSRNSDDSINDLTEIAGEFILSGSRFVAKISQNDPNSAERLGAGQFGQIVGNAEILVAVTLGPRSLSISKNKGVTWTKLPLVGFSGTSLRKILLVDGELFVCSSEGLFKSKLEPFIPQKITVATSNECEDISNQGRDLLTLTEGTVHKSSDIGLTWKELLQPGDQRLIQRMAVSGSKIVLASDGKLGVSTDHGDSFQWTDAPHVMALPILTVSETKIAMSDAKTLHLSRDGGRTWVQLSSDQGSPHESIKWAKFVGEALFVGDKNAVSVIDPEFVVR